MKTIFYLIGVLAVLWEAYTLFNLKHVHEAKLRLESSNRLPNDISGSEVALGFLFLGYWIWLVVGMLFTTQSPLFLLMIILALITNHKIRKYIVVTAIDAFLSLVVLLTIYMCVANNISSFQVIKDWILK